ncbi:hypothetical protein HUT06_25180 [Actinomadura sp. NAK00032]|uniref:hypothetical protein n=1 Tax=Actinomadura sp. NAK00032 TaxID=2742128 RepID=UPI0015915F60|nr:hypothetical protein [Actinomadura sp. NAK00032]QKW36907.1 hypothetical protein HUT06_25180 [Actinomadura sp. NAK00032]
MDANLYSAAQAAFPAALADDVRAAAQTVPEARLRPAGSSTVWVHGEQLAIPYRLYHSEPREDLTAHLSAVQAKILHCLYTRHHDGHVRQRHLAQIIEATDSWIVPFVVQLIGEPVLEIVIAIKDGLVDLDLRGSPDHQAYGRFVADNPDFLLLTSQRVASYWDCYYRNKFPHRYYPGRILIGSLKDAVATYRDAVDE